MPRRMGDWDRIALKWAQQWKDLRPWQIQERLGFAEKVGHNLILDLGCAYGRDVEFFNKLGLDSVGIDFSIKMLRQSQDSSRLIQASVTHMPFKEDLFDAVWCCSIMRYLNDDETLLTMMEANRVLIAHGLLWLSLEYGEGTRTQTKHESSFTAHLWNEERLRMIADKAGFKVLESKKYFKWRRFFTVFLEKVDKT